MLKITRKFTTDEKANAYIREFINNRIMALLIHDIEWASGDDYMKVLVTDPEYQENIHFYFPDHYGKEDAAAAFLNLLKGVKGQSEYVPSLYEEYALHAAIQSYIHMKETEGVSPAAKMPEKERHYVLEVLKKEYLDASSGVIEDENPTASSRELEEEEPIASSRDLDGMDPEYRLNTFEDMFDYDDFLTYDIRYGMLDHMTEEELNAVNG